MENQFDIVIVGGGMVGASMACALSNTSYKIAVVESFKPHSQQQPSFDERTVALTYSSKLIFNAIGIWQDISQEAYPIKDIEVTNQDSFGFTTLGVKDIHTDALGYVVPTRRIGQSLYQKLSTNSNITLFCPASVTAIENESLSSKIQIEFNQNTVALNATLVILADGGRSGLVEQSGFKTHSKTYTQSALVSIVSTDTEHYDRAYEHFTKDGPLALLPVRQADYSIAWTLNDENSKYLSTCEDEQFLSRLQSQFGHRCGKFKYVSSRHVYPLSFSHLEQPYQHQTVVIGNAAHVVHPVAGQGFNLGLRDVGFLHDLLSEISLTIENTEQLLQQYSQLRQRDTKNVSKFTDGMIQAFTSDFFSINVGRNIALSAINMLPWVKKSLLERTMGLYGRQSRLAMAGKSS